LSGTFCQSKSYVALESIYFATATSCGVDASLFFFVHSLIKASPAVILPSVLARTTAGARPEMKKEAVFHSHTEVAIAAAMVAATVALVRPVAFASSLTSDSAPYPIEEKRPPITDSCMMRSRRFLARTSRNPSPSL